MAESYDREWYNKVPIEVLNKALKGTGWDIRRIYVALSIQESQLDVKEKEALSELLKYHWEETEYKPLAVKLDTIRKQKDTLGKEK